MPEHTYSLTSRPFTPALAPADGGGNRPALWFVFRGYRLLVHLDEGAGRASLPSVADPAALGLATLRTHYVGTLDGEPCYAAEVAEASEAPDGMAFRGLRTLYGWLDEDLFWVGGRAVQIVDWDRSHQYCGRCGTPTEPGEAERVRTCPACGYNHYPRLAPAIIVAVTRLASSACSPASSSRGRRWKNA